MTHRKVLETAMDKAKEFWIFNDLQASASKYEDPDLNRLESEAWEVYEECCRLYMEELKKVREQKARHQYDHR